MGSDRCYQTQPVSAAAAPNPSIHACGAGLRDRAAMQGKRVCGCERRAGRVGHACRAGGRAGALRKGQACVHARLQVGRCMCACAYMHARMHALASVHRSTGGRAHVRLCACAWMAFRPVQVAAWQLVGQMS